MSKKKEDATYKELAKLRARSSNTCKEYRDLMEDIREFANAPDLEINGTEPELRVLVEEGHSDFQAATDFLAAEHRDILKDKITVSTVRIKLDVLCTNPEHFGITCNEDISKLRDLKLTALESCLLTSKPLTCVAMFSAALVETKKLDTRITIEECLRWLAFAAQCPVHLIIPKGEVYPQVDMYLREKLYKPTLTKIDEIQRADTSISHISNVIDYLHCSNLNGLTCVDMSILLFSICTLFLDKYLSTELFLQDKITLLVSKILQLSENPRLLSFEFGSILNSFPADMRGLRILLDCFHNAKSPHYFNISLLSFIFVGITERAEYAMEENDVCSSNEEFTNKCAKVIKDLMIDVLRQFDEDRSQQLAIVLMLDCALNFSTLQCLDRNLFVDIKDILNVFSRSWKRHGHTDDTLLEAILNNIMLRMNENSQSIEEMP